MNKYKFEANERKEQRIIQSQNKCEVCDKYFPSSSLQLSHVIPKYDRYIKKFGKEIIHHDDNLVLACSKGNSGVMLNPNDNYGKMHIANIMRKLKIPMNDIRWDYVKIK